MQEYVRSDNHYVKKRLLGEGGQGHVYEVEDAETGERYAMKRQICSEQRRIIRALTEGEIQKQLAHPHIVSFLDSFVMLNPEVENEYWVYLVLELCRGGDLFDDFQKHFKSQKFYSEDVLLSYTAQICSALNFLHSNQYTIDGHTGNLIYRDLKPENLFFSSYRVVKHDNTTEDVFILKLGDFGISRVDDAHTKTVTGSPQYLAPEIRVQLSQNLDGKAHYDEKVDLFSLGAMLFYMATLKIRPNVSDESLKPGYNLSSIKNRLLKVGRATNGVSLYSSDFVSLVTSLLDRNPRRRPSAADVLELPFMEPHLSPLERNSFVRAHPTELADKKKDRNSHSHLGAGSPLEMLCPVRATKNVLKAHDDIADKVAKGFNEVRGKLADKICSPTRSLSPAKPSSPSAQEEGQAAVVVFSAQSDRSDTTIHAPTSPSPTEPHTPKNVNHHPQPHPHTPHPRTGFLSPEMTSPQSAQRVGGIAASGSGATPVRKKTKMKRFDIRTSFASEEKSITIDTNPSLLSSSSSISALRISLMRSEKPKRFGFRVDVPDLQDSETKFGRGEKLVFEFSSVLSFEPVVGDDDDNFDFDSSGIVIRCKSWPQRIAVRAIPSSLKPKEEILELERPVSGDDGGSVCVKLEFATPNVLNDFLMDLWKLCEEKSKIFASEQQRVRGLLEDLQQKMIAFDEREDTMLKLAHETEKLKL